MVQTNTVLFGWNRALAGREGMAGELFAHSMTYFEKLKATKQIEGFEPVFLNRHGGDLNGFFLLKGSHMQLDAMMQSDEWVDIVMRADHYLSGVGVITGYTGQVIPDMMQRWVKTIPR
ncbi:hypothetical protein BH11MYX3_BH11MYX3_41090 [soil metagenome]